MNLYVCGRYIGAAYMDTDTVLKFGTSEGLYISIKTLIGNSKEHISFVSVGVLVRVVVLYVS